MAEVKMRKLPLQAKLRNHTEYQVVMWWDGIPHIWEPGEEIPNINVDIAGHFIGRHLLGLQVNPPMENDVKVIYKEEQRVLEALPRDIRADGVPLTLVEVSDPNERLEAAVTRITSIPVAPGPAVDEGLEPFAALRQAVAVEDEMEVSEEPKVPRVEDVISHDEDEEEG